MDFIDLKIKIDQYGEGSRKHYRLIICMELVELTNSAVSDDKIQVTILILRRGALSRKCSRVDNNKSIPAQYDSLWFMLKDISRFSFLVLERAFKEYRFPRKAV